jgi:hypothetical protein
MPDAVLKPLDAIDKEASSSVQTDRDDTEDKAENLLALAEQMYEKGKLGDCLVILEALDVGSSPGGQIGRQKLVVKMHIGAKNKEWWKVREPGPFWCTAACRIYGDKGQTTSTA